MSMLNQQRKEHEMKFAAIDIGSNAIRLLFTQVFGNGKEPYFKKDALFRVPIRLGEDVFVHQRISEEKAHSLIEAMIAFKHLMESYQPVDYMACATSAMREAANGAEIVKRIKTEALIDIEIINGQKEADLIYMNHIAEKLNPKKSYLYIDVGGGSTEVTLIAKGQVAVSHSFNLGTVRILNNLDSTDGWQALKNWLKENTDKYQPLAGIGSGGNINTIFSLSRKKEGKPLSFRKMKKIYDDLNSYSFEERIRLLRLKPDRADVIIPASKIFLSIMKWASMKKIYVPQIGLADGIIHMLYEKHAQNSKLKSASKSRVIQKV